MAGLKIRPNVGLFCDCYTHVAPKKLHHAWTRPFSRTTASLKSQPWTESELEILKHSFAAKLPLREIRNLLPGRTADAIRVHKHRQGLTRTTRRAPVGWTEAELATLRNALEGGMSYWEVQGMMQHRSVSALRARMNRLVLEEEEEQEEGAKKLVRWRKEDVQRVLELREREGMGYWEIAKVVGRSEEAVRNKYEISRGKDGSQARSRRNRAVVRGDGEGAAAVKQKVRWRREDDERMRLLRERDGMSWGEIAREDLESLRVLRAEKKLSWMEIGRAMGRSPDAVRVKYVDVFKPPRKKRRRGEDESKSMESEMGESGRVKEEGNEG
ncbi:hypothetical protein PRZ48_008427 [Zasmidium cellare]|uniref:Myb-like domain-containing protein n=1 Tax=Zasmidium cellare TaxID=395010 RepID=A0ABR0EGA7_ZASCE|nr:hypothetical protein PRZ48_008427 [Zasmidium cellare]